MRRQNGPQDIGGASGYGPVPRDDYHGSPYAEPWEGRVWGTTVGTAVKGLIAVDAQRAAMEGLPPLAYFSTPYWQRWLYSLEVLFVRDGVLTPDEIERRVEEVAADPDRPLPERSDPEAEAILEFVLAQGAPFFLGLDAGQPPAFAVGDRVRTRTVTIERHGEEHTRLPGYAQARTGVIARYHAALPLPDATVAGERRVEHVYAVRFDGDELWPDARANSSVCVDLWESYLEPAP